MGRTTVDEMVSGMGMGTKVLELLLQGVKDEGGRREIFAFLVRPRFKEELQKVCRAIVACNWRIPASEMRRLAQKSAMCHYEIDPKTEADKLAEMTNLCWWEPCTEFGIPYETYCSDPNSGRRAIPPLLLDRFHGQKMEHPLIIKQGVGAHEKQRVVVHWNMVDDLVRPGETIDANKIDLVGLADANFFDFEH